MTPAERARILAAIRAARLAGYVYDPAHARRCALASAALSSRKDGGM